MRVHVRTLATLFGLCALAVGAHWANATSDVHQARYGHLEPAWRFDYPVGRPDAEGWTNAQPFGHNFHLGDDWNLASDPWADLGEPVHSIAVGEVTWAGDAGEGWGNVVRVVHHVRRKGASSFVESVYAHLDEVHVHAGERIERGAVLGTVGDAHGRYVPHLHLEIRRQPDLPLGPGYSANTAGYLDPTAFIEAHR